jgi:iron complex transport system substrate-binding protein
VTEIVYELGQDARLAADDLSSLYPEAATRLPRVGYYRALPVEGVLSMQPDLVLASEHAGPPLVIKRIGDLGIKVETVSDAPSVASLYQRITQVAKALGVPARGVELLAQTRRDIEQAQALPAVRRRAVLVINRTGQFQGAGRDTAADALLGLAGLDNALARQRGYKPLSSEGLAALAPDMIVVTRASVQASGGLAGFLGNPGVAATPAAAAQRIVVMDDLLALGLGPRLAQAIRQLKDAAGR